MTTGPVEMRTKHPFALSVMSIANEIEAPPSLDSGPRTYAQDERM